MPGAASKRLDAAGAPQRHRGGPCPAGSEIEPYDRPAGTLGYRASGHLRPILDADQHRGFVAGREIQPEGLEGAREPRVRQRRVAFFAEHRGRLGIVPCKRIDAQNFAPV